MKRSESQIAEMQIASVQVPSSNDVSLSVVSEVAIGD